ncbi:thioesterase domain-containing protein [Umezawaea sp. Da 62-37]|uniref:thioesterase II family protein n=1 Tax=Umezawaea sp. Da 62-37 TaxID=3075927 RepID=UPI0028F6F1D2|nr:thioesterase domain-containing protein [Umezawaea sp. Da 62-37]WNV84696.1 thioesterase domain-containing protein [Umezawaea sp. Da 62-37]
MDERRWLKGLGRRGGGRTRLLCFHYAGGSAAMFRQWWHLLPDSVEPVAVQLPGRADRFGEPPHTTMAALVEDLVDVLGPVLDHPYACFGASMGARVSWVLSHALRDRHLPMPRKLYVSSSSGPVLEEAVRGWDGTDDELVAYVRELGGTPPEVLDDSGLLTALLPVLRADLTVLASHEYRPSTPLDVPVHVFAGRHDLESTPERMAAWRAETSAAFDLDLIDTGHFLDDDAVRRVTDVIGRDLG